MGKYDGVNKTLAPMPVEDDSYQAKLDAIKAETRKTDVYTPESLAKKYQTVRETKDALKDELYEIQAIVTALEQMLVESHESDETGWGMYGAPSSTVKLASGAAVRIEYEPAGKVEDKELFRQWCIANGLENALQLWPATMNTIVKERLLAGAPAPDGVKAYVVTRVKLIKG